MQERALEISIAARLCHAGMPKLSIIAAFRQSRSLGTSFIEELYAVEGVDEALIGGCLAEEAGLAFAEIPHGVRVIAPQGADFAGLQTLRHVLVLTADNALHLYMAPTLADIAQIRRAIATSPANTMRLGITTPSRLMKFLLSCHQTYLAENAVRMIDRGDPRHSARIVVTGRQGAVLGALAASALFLASLMPAVLWSAIHATFSIFFTGCILLRLAASSHASAPHLPVGHGLASYGLPAYTVLVALYMEADVVDQLVRAMKALNWPSSRLEVLFLCEADDHSTLAAFERQDLPARFSVIALPASGPRTKPKALNFGLQLATGDYIVVYDAEDRPHANQLHEAWSRFRCGPHDLGCLQAPLVIANADDGWMERQFAFEYAAQFRGLLRWLAHSRCVLPLGGSSNHFRRDCLVKVGGWDPFNVTEDAELGTRLARYGFYCDMLSTPTIEDAPTGAGVWLRQRTRWFKGWMQTWLVEMRRSPALLEQLGCRRFAVYHLLTAGMIISALLYPFMLVFIFRTMMIAILAENPANFPMFDLANVIMGFASFHLLGRAALKKERMAGSILPLMPIYWLLISAAAWRALWQLHAAPFLWEKTPHRPARAADGPGLYEIRT
ncbi:MAG: glycosyltransferase [Phyllobacterium sp.]